jgi:hypothetical protein
VSRFNVSVLLATTLLGVLLWVVLNIARDFARAPDEPLPQPEEEPEITFDPALPQLLEPAALQSWLTSRGEPAVEMLDAYRNWLIARGYPTGQRRLLSNVTDGPPDLSDLGDPALLSLAGNGHIEAMHELADRSLETDPLAALEWYDQAVINGSLYAMERVADLLATLSDPAIDNFTSDPLWQEALLQIRSASPAPRERALAWAIATVTAGGYAIMSPEHANRITALTEQLDAAALDRACETAQEYVLAAAAARRARGEAVFSMQTPPVALSIARPAEIIPCDVGVPPLVSLEQCEASDFVGPGPKVMTVWICTR